MYIKHIFLTIISKLQHDVTDDKAVLRDRDFPSFTVDCDSGCLEASVLVRHLIVMQTVVRIK